MRATLRLAALTLCLIAFGADLATAQNQPPPRPQSRDTFKSGEIVREGHRFFGTVSRGLAQVVEKAVSHWGQPNGYVLGQEGSGAFVVGLRYGDGTLYTKNAGDLRVFWQGPSVGFDCRRRRRPHHDAGLQPAARPTRSISASPASTARPISSAASA